jgi:hypothetical protein
VVGCASVAEYDRTLIKKHEKTRADKEDDRTRHIEELAPTTSPSSSRTAPTGHRRLVARGHGARPSTTS